MISSRSLAISMSWLVLSAAPLICAQEVEPSSEAILQPTPVIQELELPPQRFLNFFLQAQVSAPLTYSQDLSKYREFELGTNLLAVAKQANMKPSEARAIHQRPAVIQELEWRPPRSFNSSPEVDPVKEVLFSFYNGELFRMLVTYDQYRTQGLTDEDMVEAISAIYGTATRPAATILPFSLFHGFN